MKNITDQKDINFLLSITENMITKTFILDLFGNFGGEQRFDPSDIFRVPKNSYGPEGKRNKNDFTTTVGLWVYNKFVIEKDLFDLFQYINKPINGKMIKTMQKILSYAVLEDQITLPQFDDYLQKNQWLMNFVSILSPNHTEKLLNTSNAIDSKRKELFKKYEKELEEGNVVIADKIEKELIQYAKEYLKDDPGLDIYESGARSKFDNSFKNTYIMRGIVATRDPKKPFKIVKGNYLDGIDREDFAVMADTPMVDPMYASAKNTAEAGYVSKQYRRAFQHVVLGPKDSDCKTDGYIELYLTEDNIEGYMYNYIIEGSSLVELTSDKISKYLNKKVKMRFSSFCKMKEGVKCNKCMGNLYYRHGIKNIGFLTMSISNKILNLNLKKKHVNQVSLIKPDLMKIFGIKE